MLHLLQLSLIYELNLYFFPCFLPLPLTPLSSVSLSLFHLGGRYSISFKKGNGWVYRKHRWEFSTSKLDFMSKNFQGNALFRQVCSLAGRSQVQLVHLLTGRLHSHKQCKHRNEGLTSRSIRQYPIWQTQLPSLHRD